MKFGTGADVLEVVTWAEYNFRSEIHGTGSRSEITVKSSLE